MLLRLALLSLIALAAAQWTTATRSPTRRDLAAVAVRNKIDLALVSHDTLTELLRAFLFKPVYVSTSPLFIASCGSP